MRVGFRILTASLLCLIFGTAFAGPSNIDQIKTILRKEIKFSRFDEVRLGPNRACPEWVKTEKTSLFCRRLDVVYRGVYTSGMLIHSQDGSDELTIYHVGHEAGAAKSFSDPGKLDSSVIGDDAAWLVNQFLEVRSDVLILFMPGTGFAPEDARFSSETKRLHSMLIAHSVFSLLDFAGDSAAAYFIAHVRGFLDRYASAYTKISMVGRSGGGWVTTLAAAFDQRIQCSVSVFGTLPMKLRLPVDGDDRNDLGDFEQYGLMLFKKLDYLDLYALASLPPRHHGLILNEADDCCFSGKVKGRLMWGEFIDKYPRVRNFTWLNLPPRSDSDNMNLDKFAFAAIRKVCPQYWRGG
jgi:hypothetical protein